MPKKIHFLDSDPESEQLIAAPEVVKFTLYISYSSLSATN